MIPRLTCPECGATAYENKTIHTFAGPVKLGWGFDFKWDETVAREILGFDKDGHLVIGRNQDTGDEKNERIACYRCGHEWPVTDEEQKSWEFEI